MSKSTSQIEREIEATRAEIEGTLAALRSRMSLGEVVEEVSRQFRATGGPDMMRNFGRQVRENPLPLALIGAGIAWLVIGNGRAAYRHEHELEPYDLDGEYDPDYEYNPYTGTHASQLPPTGTGPSAGASVAPGAQLGADGGGEETQRRGGMASGLSESVSDAASRAGETASSAAAAVGDRASAMADTVARQARWAARRTGAGAARAGRGVQRSFLDLVEEQPLVVGALGIAVGAAIGALLPSTRTEDRWVGPTRDRVRDEAARVGREQYEKATHVAEKAYESAKAEADAQGLTPQQDKTVAERVEEVAKAAAETAQTEAKREGLGKP